MIQGRRFGVRGGMFKPAPVVPEFCICTLMYSHHRWLLHTLGGLCVKAQLNIKVGLRSQRPNIGCFQLGLEGFILENDRGFV